MSPHHPGPHEPDPGQTVRHRWPQPPPPPPQQPPGTVRMPYTPDLLPDVPQYGEAKPPRSAWWWAILVGGIAVLVAGAAVAVILWARSTSPPVKPDPGHSQVPAGDRVSDRKARLSYPKPKGWTKREGGPYSSGLKKDGGIVVAFTKPGTQASIEQLQAQVRQVAEEQAHALLPGNSLVEGVTTSAVDLGGTPGASASFKLTFTTRDPAYVRVVAVQSAKDRISFVYGSLTPDSEDGRKAIDAILDGVTLG